MKTTWNLLQPFCHNTLTLQKQTTHYHNSWMEHCNCWLQTHHRRVGFKFFVPPVNRTNALCKLINMHQFTQWVLVRIQWFPVPGGMFQAGIIVIDCWNYIHSWKTSEYQHHTYDAALNTRQSIPVLHRYKNGKCSTLRKLQHYIDIANQYVNTY